MSKGLFFSLAIAVIWACSIVNSRYLLALGENPLNLTVWISIFEFIPWLILFGKHSKEFMALSGRYKLLLIGLGIISSVGIDYLQAIALAHTSAVNFSFLYRTIVVYTIILAYFFFKEQITRKKGLLVALILLGSYLLTTNGQGIRLTVGDLYTLLYAASAAFISNILIKHTVAKMHPDLSGAAISLVSTATLVTLAVTHNRIYIPQHFPLIILAAMLSIGVTAVRNRAYQNATASFVTMIVSLTPVFVAFLSYPLLHERLGVVETVGGLIIIGSTFFVEKFKI
jgi:drug/metabolite transporter (DMT)-like permease